MVKDTRVLAVQLENDLFDKLDSHIKEEGITKQRYISDLIANDLEQKQQQRQGLNVNSCGEENPQRNRQSNNDNYRPCKARSFLYEKA